MIVSDLLYVSQRLSRVLKFAGRTASIYEFADSLAQLNAMLDSWNTERLTVYSIARQVFTLLNQEVITIGAGGNFNVPRPVRIENAGVILTSGGEFPLRMLNKDQYAATRLKSLNSTFPTSLYDDRAFPLAGLHFWPVPNGGDQVALYTWQQLTQFGALGDTVSLPPGYVKAIQYNLAVEIAAMHPENSISPLTISIAAESKAAIKRLNAPAPLMSTDLPASLSGRGIYNIYTGGFER